MSEEVTAIRAAILARHATLYAFCGAHGLPRGTVYQVMRGRYAGNAEAQLARIRAALNAPKDPGQNTQAVIKALSTLACAACDHGKRACRKKRHACQKLWQAQAAALDTLAMGGNESWQAL